MSILLEAGISMKYGIWSAALAPLALASTALAAKFPLSSLKSQDGASPGGVVPNKFIVELSAPLGGSSKRDVVSREVSALLLSKDVLADLRACMYRLMRLYMTSCASVAWASMLTRNSTLLGYLSVQR